MKANIQTKVESYLEILNEIKAKVSDEASAVRILGEVAKDVRMEQMREEREGMNGEPATVKQLQYLKTLGVQVNPGVTKKQASRLIDNATTGQDD